MPLDPTKFFDESAEFPPTTEKANTVGSEGVVSAVQDLELRQAIQATKWIVGAVNLDEDLHFSSYYLRASAKANLPDHLRAYGYSKIIAVFHDLNERYFLSETECQ